MPTRRCRKSAAKKDAIRKRQSQKPRHLQRVPCEIVIAMLKRFKIIADRYRKPPIWPALLPHRRDLQHGARGHMMVMQEVYSPPTCRLCPADNDTFFGKGAPGAARDTLHDEPHGLRVSALSRHRADDLVSGLPNQTSEKSVCPSQFGRFSGRVRAIRKRAPHDSTSFVISTWNSVL
jgi:hypothetical protein